MTAPLSRLLAGIAPAPDLEVTGVQTDSRQVVAGNAFLAVQGVGSHGLQYVEAALDRGASVVVWEPAPGVVEPDHLPVPLVAVAGLSKRVGEIAARSMGEPSRRLFTVGVTGTDGKTSTAWLIAQAFDALDRACGYMGTIGYGRIAALAPATHTTPDAIRLQQLLAGFVADGLKTCAMEVSSHALDQGRVSGIGFDVAILTNITRDHLDYHGTLEAYVAAKKRLFTEYARGAVVLNRDDAIGAAWAMELSRYASRAAGLTVYGVEGLPPSAGRWLLARALKLTPQGLHFTLDSSWGHAAIESPLLGLFNVYNLLAMLAALLVAGVPLAHAARVTQVLHTVPGRIEGFRGGPGTPMVVVDYAHTPGALGQILKAVREHCTGRLICVFGCGGDRDRGKRPLMGRAAYDAADIIFVTDDNPRSEAPEAIAAQILAGIPDRHAVQVIHDRAEAIRTAIALAREDDVVLVAGKGHETTQTHGNVVRAFSDRDCVAALLGTAAPATGETS